MKATKVAKEWNGKRIFENIDMEIARGEHIALFGRNGVGKTTLLQMLLGQTEADEGSIQRFVPVSEWGVMDQHVFGCDDQSAYDFIAEGVSELNSYEVEKTLRKLKLDKSIWNVPFGKLSGGQKTKAQIARLVVSKPEFLILDEPTNHLDQESIEWLEEWLRSYPGAVLFVSHDRAFLDRAANAIYELSPMSCKKYPGGYSDYRRHKELERQTQAALYKKQEQEKQALLESIRRYRQWFDQADRSAANVEVGIQKSYFKARALKNISRYHAKEKELERLEANRVEQPKDAAKVKVKFNSGNMEAGTFLKMEQVNFAYGEKPMFRNVTLHLARGDRLAVVGPNGSGKTTLLKLMVGELTPDRGIVKYNPQLRIGYFSQEMEQLRSDDTILDSLLVLPDMTQSHARTILGCFLFSRDDVYKRICDLSMGERCRVAFIRLYFGDSNVLVLDEPSNYLDIETREKMEEAFESYPGAIVVVSHDRYLVDRLATRIAALQDGSVYSYPGTYREFRDRQRGGAQDAGREVLERENELRRLELRAAQMMSSDGGDQLIADPEFISELRSINARMKELRESIK